jgi:hypothetical protein
MLNGCPTMPEEHHCPVGALRTFIFLTTGTGQASDGNDREILRYGVGRQ